MKKKAIITFFLFLVALTGQGQVKCHIEGILETNVWGDEIIICEDGTDLRVVDEPHFHVKAMENAAKKDGYPWPSLLELNDENQVWKKNGAGNSGGAMYLIDRDGTILSTSTDAEELESIIKKALNIE